MIGSPGPLPDPAPQPPAGYLDAVAGQPLLPVARAAWAAAAERGWSDPARLHHLGRRAGLLLDAARAQIAGHLRVRADEVWFTSSGPTALAVAVQGLLGSGRRGRRAVASAVESMAVLSPLDRVAEEVTRVGVSATGRVDLGAFGAALADGAGLACLQVANGEVGTRQPVQEAAALARAAGTPLLVHALQVVGREPIPEGWDVLAASARDWGGPAGVGILVVRSHVDWRPEENPDRGWVGGFPDVPGAAAAATALDYLAPVQAAESDRLRALVARLRTALPEVADGIVLAGDPEDRLPHILTFTCAGVVGEALVIELDRRGVAVASGSACTSDTRMPSAVLAELGLRPDAGIRVSLPLGCAEASVDLLLDQLPGALAVARGTLAG